MCSKFFRKHRLYITYNNHDIPLAGHPCFQKTYMTVKHHHYCPRMKEDVKIIC